MQPERQIPSEQGIGPEQDTLLLKASFSRRGERLSDPLLYEQMHASASLSWEGASARWLEEVETEISLSYDPSEDCYTAEVPVYPGSTVNVLCRAEGDTLSCNADALSFTSKETDAIIVDRLPKQISLEGMFPEDTMLSLELSGMFEAWDGSKMSVKAHADSPNLFMVEEKNIPGQSADVTAVSLKGLKSGSGNLILNAQDRYGNRRECIVPVQVLVRWEKLRRILLCAGMTAAAVILIMIPVLILRRKKGSLHGTLVLTGNAFSGEEEGVSFSLEGFSDGTNLLRVLTGEERADQEHAPFRELLAYYPDGQHAQIMSVLEDITLQGARKGRKGNCLQLKNKSESAALFDCYGSLVKRTFLQDQDTFEIRFGTGGSLLGCCDLKE